MARVHPEPNTMAKLQLLDASNTVLAEALSDGENDWETLRLVYDSDSAQNDVKLRLLADGDNALFYADTAHVYDVTNLLRWQDFRYDGQGRAREKPTLTPKPPRSFARKNENSTYQTTGNGQGLLKRVDQHDTPAAR